MANDSAERANGANTFHSFNWYFPDTNPPKVFR